MTMEPIDIEATLAKRLYGQTEAGNAMNAEVAHRVFGRDIVFFNTLSWSERGWIYGDVHIGLQKIPAYSTDIAAAWKVVQHLQDAGWLVDITCFSHQDATQVDLYRAEGQISIDSEPTSAGTAVAICRAALAACVGPGPTGDRAEEQ